ncbi:MAG TPA: DUF262 domain-containing protein [Candidatus Xenobia bacterium]|jgi:hypothetical protein
MAVLGGEGTIPQPGSVLCTSQGSARGRLKSAPLCEEVCSMTISEDGGLPMVTDVARGQVENVQTIINRMQTGRIVIPDYQRDAEQWDDRKESLFIESILNNLTIPAFFFAENESEGSIEVVDGQQRLTTILKYAADEFKISDDDDVVYLSPQSVHYKGFYYKDLQRKLQNVFNDYPLTIIYLPKRLELSTKLEIFRRINEGGTPLTAQDIRLSYYSSSPSVNFVRLVGLYSASAAATRMLESAAKKDVTNPWDGRKQYNESWQSWWKDKAKAKGQTPSEMFLWYLIMLNRTQVGALVASQDALKHLSLSFRGTTEEVLDVYCAQLLWTDERGGPIVLPTYTSGLKEQFKGFALWMHAILNRGLAGISVDKYKQLALLIGACVELKVNPKDISDDVWDIFGSFVRTPRQAGDIIKDIGGYPEPKGRWSGQKGQRAQCQAAIQLVERAVERY